MKTEDTKLIKIKIKFICYSKIPFFNENIKDIKLRYLLSANYLCADENNNHYTLILNRENRYTVESNESQYQVFYSHDQFLKYQKELASNNPCINLVSF